jgi:methionyl-tRNA synthetase
VRVTDPIFPRADTSQYIGGAKVEEKPVTSAQADSPSPGAEPALSGANGRHPFPEGEGKAADSAAPGAPAQETTQAAAPDMAKISIDQFMQIDLRVAEVRAAERVPKSKKLMKMTVSTGDEERTIVAGIAAKYTPEELVGRKVVIVANLQPAKLMGVESNGMVLAASIDGEPSLLSVDTAVPAGTKVK